MECGNMGVFDRGVQMLLTTVGAFAAFSLMTIAVGTDYWLYSRGVCKIKSNNENETSKKNEEVMTHSGLWRTCCLEGETNKNAALPPSEAPVAGPTYPKVENIKEASVRLTTDVCGQQRPSLGHIKDTLGFVTCPT